MDENIAGFTTQLLNTGDTLLTLIDNLTDALVESGEDDREEAAADVLGMVAGSLALRFASIPAADVVRATELMALAMQCVFDDVIEAIALSSRSN
jgi:hypothetical protein